MRIRQLAALLLPALALTGMSAGGAAAAGAAHGSFSYSYYPLVGGEESSACSETSTAGWCYYGSFSVDGPGKPIQLGSGACAGSFGATLAVRSGFAGLLVVPGTFVVAAGKGEFTGVATSGNRVVRVEARYTGTFCQIDTTLPIPTYISGTYDIVAG